MLQTILVLCALCQLSTVRLAAAPSKNVLLLRERVPLTLKYCTGLGYKETSRINFIKQSHIDAKNNHLYKALHVLDRMGCSEFVKGYACSLFAPAYLAKYKSALPPCKSLCETAENQCSKFKPLMRKIFKNVQFYCEYLKEPSDKYGCIDYKLDDDQAKLVMIVKGKPHVQTSDWKVPTI